MPSGDFIIYVYCCVEDTLSKISIQKLRTRGFAPKLTDAEVITMELVGDKWAKIKIRPFGDIFETITAGLPFGRVIKMGTWSSFTRSNVLVQLLVFYRAD